jgi:DNA-binding transcriptional regulator YiaG
MNKAQRFTPVSAIKANLAKTCDADLQGSMSHPAALLSLLYCLSPTIKRETTNAEYRNAPKTRNLAPMPTRDSQRGRNSLEASAAYRRGIAALKRQVIALERKSTVLAKLTAAAVNAPTALADKPVRFVAKGLRTLRTRLGLSAKQLSLLLGVSEQSVYNWENKKATPRKEQLAAIIGMRELGKREAQERLEALTSPRKRGKATR